MGVAIVAIPNEDDHIWKVSSEKVPHMTLLFLGEEAAIPDLEAIVLFVQHTVETIGKRFDLSVDHRGILGLEKAEVFFFNPDKGDIKGITELRTALLLNPLIKQAYNSTEQFPIWTPHLTLGYPTTPPKETDPDASYGWVSFNRIAVWTGDFTGPEFRLKDDLGDLAMSDISQKLGGVMVNPTLTHHGVKGQKWGVRREEGGGGGGVGGNKPSAASVKAATKKEFKERTGSEVIVRNSKGDGVRTVGGNKREAHADAVKVRTAEQIAKRSTTDALSTKDLQELVTRMNLEQQYRNLAVNEYRSTAGEKYATQLLQSGGTALAKKIPGSDAIISDVIAKQTGNKALQGGKVKSGDNK